MRLRINFLFLLFAFLACPGLLLSAYPPGKSPRSLGEKSNPSLARDRSEDLETYRGRVRTEEIDPWAIQKLESPDLNSLVYESATSLKVNEMSRNKGHKLCGPKDPNCVAWARLSDEGDVQVSGPDYSHCTSATIATLKKTLGRLRKAGLIKMDDQVLATVNSQFFRDVWNSNGFGPNKIIELLGGQSFIDRRLAEKGDFLKIDRSKTGHVVIFNRFVSGKVCYFSSQGGTRGLGETCEDLSKISKLTFSRLNSISKLQEGLDQLSKNLESHQSLGDVRKRKDNGFVAVNSLNIVGPLSLWQPLTFSSAQSPRGAVFPFGNGQL